MQQIYLNTLALAAPGLVGWQASVPILTGIQPYQATPLPTFSPNLLPPNARRRTTATIKLALQVAHEALEHSTQSAQQLSTVFASCSGNTEVIDNICRALTLPDRPVSPTYFHNSVHNAPAGYWAIATHSQMPSNTLSAYGASFAAGLLEACTLAIVEQIPVLLVCYDNPFPPPLEKARFFYAPFAVALLLTPEQTIESCAKLNLQLAQQQTIETQMAEAALETLRTGNPAARSLPLLQAIAQAVKGRVILPYLEESQLIIELEPC
jgi:hypothetical protein